MRSLLAFITSAWLTKDVAIHNDFAYNQKLGFALTSEKLTFQFAGFNIAVTNSYASWRVGAFHRGIDIKNQASGSIPQSKGAQSALQMRSIEAIVSEFEAANPLKKKCGICSAPDVDKLAGEMLKARGHTRTGIARFFESRGISMTREQVKRHYIDHKKETNA